MHDEKKKRNHAPLGWYVTVTVAFPGHFDLFFTHLSQRLKVSYCARSCPSCINFFFKRHLLLNNLTNLKKFRMNVPSNALYQNA